MKPVLIVPAFFLSATAMAQLPNTQWLRTAGGFSQFERYLSAADATGHVYTAGLGTATDFGNGVTVPSEGRVIARYDSSGTISWARALTTAPNEYATVSAIATNSEGDVWIAGHFLSSTLTLDTIVLPNAPSTSSAFLARMDSTGAVEFAIAWGGTELTVTDASDVCVDGSDNVFVAGQTSATSFTVGGGTLTNLSGGQELFALKFNANGGELWGGISQASQGAESCCIAADATGKAYVVGKATGEFIIGQDTVDTGFITQAVLIKFDFFGVVEHVEVLAECQPLDLDVDDAGNAYVCGWIDTMADFGGDTLVPSVLDGFVAAYASDGSYRWVVGVQGEIDNEICWSVDLDAAQTGLYVGGTFVFDAWFGGMHVETGLSPTDGFIMQLDTAGTVNWVKDMTGDGPTLFAEAHLDPWGHLYASGVTQSMMSYLGEPVQNGGGNHAFLARFGDLSTSVPAVAQAGDLHLYPNPCDGVFTIELPPDARTVIIEDGQGHLRQRVPVLGSLSSTFHIGTPGIYFVTVLSDAGRTVERIIVE
jgi:hypothetical protein